MVITHIMGGIGNQLFQYALGRSLAHRLNTELKLDITQCQREKSSHHNYYRLGEFNVQENFATVAEIKGCRSIIEGEKHRGIFQPDVLNAKDPNIYLHGYWVTEKYFSDIADILRRELTLRNPLGRISSSWREKILAADCAVSLHARRGDFLTPLIRNNSGVLPIQYYRESVIQLKDSYPNLTIFVFSDDLKWAKKNMNFGVPVEFVEGCERDSEELYLMSLCKHNIIASSTFSWWGAWLNPNPNKRVFVPHPYGRRALKPHDRIPDSWIKIPVDYEKHAHDEFPVFMSIIICVENNADTFEITMSSVFSQIFKDYEIIIVDTSNDGSEKIYKPFEGNANVSIIKAECSNGKVTSWNLGIERANGEYVLLLTGKDFILQNTTQILAQFTYNYLKTVVEIVQGKYIDSENYDGVFPNVILTSQRMEETASGTVRLNGIANRKFSVMTDLPFQNIRSITELNINSAQKLTALATNQINNIIGTKFFKRSFLVENNIRFDENLKGGGAELMFLVDAFMRTDRIIVVPQVFYGRMN